MNLPDGSERFLASETASDTDTGHAPPLTRRRLLQAASAGALLHAFGKLADAREIVARRPVEPLSVGYLEDSDRLPSLRRQPWRLEEAEGARIIPAAKMPLGDQQLALSTVEMRVHGFYPETPPLRVSPCTTVVLTAFFPSFDPLSPDPKPYYSWQSRLRPAPSTGAPLRFPVPLRDDGGLELVLEVFDGRPSPAGQGAPRILRKGGRRQAPLAPAVDLRSLYTDFTVDWYGGRPKLQRGVYFLGLSPGVWRTAGELAGSLAWKDSDDGERWSLVVSFERAEEHALQAQAAALT